MKTTMRWSLQSAVLLVAALAAQVARAQPTTLPPGPEGPPLAPAEGVDSLDRRLSPLFSSASGLTSDQVAARTTATSAELAARREDVQVAAAQVDQALVAYFPRLSASAGYTRLSDVPAIDFGTLVTPPASFHPSGPAPLPAGTKITDLGVLPLKLPVPSNETIFQATLSIPISDYLLRLSQSHEAASRNQRAAELNEVAARSSLGAIARVGYYSWARAKLQLAVAQQAFEQAQGHATDVRHSFDAGIASRADVLRTESQVASSQLLVLRSNNLVGVLEERLRIQMHARDVPTAAIGEDLNAQLAPLPGESSLDDLFAEALEHRPEIRALEQTGGSLREQARVVRAGYLPRLDATGQLLEGNPNPRYFPATQVWNFTWSAGVALSWSPNDLAASAASARVVDARVAQVEAQKAAIRDQLRDEVVSAQQGIADAEAAIGTTAMGLAAAEESYRVRRALFRAGRATNLELTDAETDLTRARLEVINARIDLRIARVRLAHATGRDARLPPR